MSATASDAPQRVPQYAFRSAAPERSGPAQTTAGAPRQLDLTLGAELARDLALPVDVRRLNDAPVPFLFKALRGRIVATQDPLLLASVMERTARAYHDIAPVLERAARDAFAP